MNHPWPRKNVFFTGFMASGKSRIGEQTANLMGWHFVDTDRYIEKKTGLSISDIFKFQGEASFRQMEFEAIQELCDKEYHIIALGGGALAQKRIADLIKDKGILIRLNASVEVLSERIGRKNTRPLMAGLNEEERRAKIAQMLEEREPYYALADLAIESTDDIAVEQLVRQVRNYIVAWNYKKVTVDTSSGKYPIFIGRNFVDLTNNILQGLGVDGEPLIVTDNNVARDQAHNLRKLKNSLGNVPTFKFPSGEKYKTIQTLNRLYTFMLRKGYTRKSTLVQFSGGVVGDMAGYGAASYQRGIPFVQVPTTLLSMVDSSVGGKVAVNHQLGKNMIGAFYQPKAVLINLEVLHTLDPTEYLAGLCEVVKYGVIYDESFFAYLEEKADLLLNHDDDILETTIARCCAIKAEVVSQDERENGIRAILNYGHTFGHAIEKLTEYQTFSHGIAVGLGMRVAGRLSTLMGLWKPEDEERQNKLLNALKIPDTYHVNKAAAWEAMGIDKKASRGKRVFILPEKIGKVKKVVNPPEDLIAKAWEAIGEPH